MEMVCCFYRPIWRHIGYCLEGILTCEESFQTHQTTAHLCVERGGELQGWETALKCRTYCVTIIQHPQRGGALLREPLTTVSKQPKAWRGSL